MPDRATEDRRLFKRLLHSHHDLVHAEACANQILTRGLHRSGRGSEDRGLLECLNTALIVSYSRPFSGNKGSADVAGSLPEKYLRVFDAQEKALHRLTIQARDRDQAHSDPLARSIMVSVDQMFGEPVITPVGRDPFVPLPLEDVVRLKGMIVKLLGKLQVEQQKLAARFKPGERF